MAKFLGKATMSDIVLFIHRIVFILDRCKIIFVPNILNKLFIRILFSCQIGVGTKFGKGVILGYGGLGVVIHERAVIGNRVVINPGVSIGGTTKKYEVPIIGDNTILSSGAKIIGPISIGENCVIGANAVVLNNIPDNCVAVGVPARIIKTGINIEKYR